MARTILKHDEVEPNRHYWWRRGSWVRSWEPVYVAKYTVERVDYLMVHFIGQKDKVPLHKLGGEFIALPQPNVEE